MHGREDFAIETTLASRSYLGKIQFAKQNGYHVVIIFFWLRDIQLAIERVAARVQKGGHHIPSDVIARRYQRGIKNFFELYLSLADYWVVIDNSVGAANVLAEGESTKKEYIVNKGLWKTVKASYDPKTK